MSTSPAGSYIEMKKSITSDRGMISAKSSVVDAPKKIANSSDLKSSSPNVDRPRAKSSKPPGSAKRSIRSSKSATPRSLIPPKTPSSSIPLPVKSPKNSSPVSMLSRSSLKPSKPSSLRLPTMNNKHTLEIQFINKKRRLAQLRKELLEKQKPVLDLYQNLMNIKKKLEELGKTVQLEEIKLLPVTEEKERKSVSGDGETTISPEAVSEMKLSIEEIPKTLMGICQNLLSRRAVIVELLESVTKSEVDVSEMSERIDSLKSEGTELQKSLDAIISEHEQKINQLVINWQNLLQDKSDVANNAKVEHLDSKLKEQERLVLESNLIIQDLQRRLDDKRVVHDKSVVELENVIHDLRDKIKKLEQEVENEKKITSDTKVRNSTNNQTIKSLRQKILEWEIKNKDSEEKNTDVNRKLKFLQDQLKTKETQWSKEKDEMMKNMKSQENLLQKLTNDRNEFETRYKQVEEKTGKTENEMQDCILNLKSELEDTKEELCRVSEEKADITKKFNEMEGMMRQMGMESKLQMQRVTDSVSWGKAIPGPETGADILSNNLANEITIQNLQDQIKQYEKEKQEHLTVCLSAGHQSDAPKETCEEDNKALLLKHQECITKYQQLLQESEDKLRVKSREVAKLTGEILHLKVRQDALEEQNINCPTGDLQKMVEEGRHKLNDLMKKSMENEQKIANYESVIEKQNRQLNEMENLLRYRENMSGVMKASRDELLLEKESLTRYSQEMRTVLAEVTKEGKIKDRVIKELNEKLDLRERQISRLEKEVRELESNLMMTNEKRFKLQETVGTMEKELQSTKAHVNQLADIRTRYDAGMQNTQSFISEHNSTHISASSNNINDINVGKVNYRNHLNSRSLIGMSMRKIDYLRNRLHQLTKMNVITSDSDLVSHRDNIRKTRAESCSTQTLSNTNVDKILELTAKRYELLQKEAYESYEELCTLIKKSANDVTTKKITKLSINQDPTGKCGDYSIADEYNEFIYY